MTLVLAALAVGSFTLTRTILLACTGPSNVPVALWPLVFAKGLFFDTAALAYILPPFLLADALLPASVRERRWFARSGLVLLIPVIFLLLFLTAAEITFWIEFHTRFNFIALDYLIYTNEVLRNIWESYPVVWIFGGMGIFSVIFGWYLHKNFWEESTELPSRNVRGFYVAIALVAPFLSAYFVDIETMHRGGNAYAEELSGNGLFTLASASRHNELDYDQFYATLPQDKADRILRDLGVEWTDDLHRRQTKGLETNGHSHPLPSFLIRRPRNVILISVESLSASFVGAYGSPDGLTPKLDKLAREGLQFDRVFATGTRTVRGLEALSLATPPIPGQAILRRPKNARLASMGEMLKHQGFDVFFLYGGYGYFDNMSVFFQSNAYTVLDRTAIPENLIPMANVWGVADEALFDNTLRVLDETATSKKRMFAHVMTTSNHRPYTYPNGRIDIPSPGGRRGAVKYTDFAIGQFIEKARSKPWFKDTVFVIVADHCASVAGRTQLPVADYRIPLILYGPGLVKPGRIDRMISQIDIPPTLFDILGTAGDDNFFGVELPEQKGPARAFISNYQNLGYYKNDQLIVLKPKREIESYRVNPITFESSASPADPILVNEAIAYYQTASRAYKYGKLELLWK